MSRTNSRVSTSFRRCASVSMSRALLTFGQASRCLVTATSIGSSQLTNSTTVGRGPRNRSRSSAARFAAKEAVMKVLRPVDDAPSWNEIEVRTTQGGWPEIELSGVAARMATDERPRRLFSFTQS